MKHNREFDAFLKDEVNLNRTRIDRLNGHVKAVSEFLSQNLDSYIKVERQGSYALHTMIKPVREHQEYDADILLFMQPQKGWQARDYINALYKCLLGSGVYADKARRQTRCVMIDYAGDFHLDVVPCLVGGDGNLCICNHTANKFEPTDGTGYREWFNRRNSLTHGNLKRVTRLLKYLRDHKGNYTAPSILMTTLIGNTVVGSRDGETFKSLPDSLVAVSNRINDFLQANPRMPRIANPVLPYEDFTRKWDQRKYENFRKQFQAANDLINEADAATEPGASIAKWRKVFGDDFAKGRSTNRGGGSRAGTSRGTAAGAASVAVTPQRPYAR